MTTKTKTKSTKPKRIDHAKLITSALKRKDGLSSAIDQLADLREARLAKDREARELARQESEAAGAIADVLKQQGLRSATGVTGRIDLKEDLLFTVDDWDALLRFAARKGNSDLIQQRVAVTAARARFEDGKTLPGLTPVRRLRPVIGSAKV